MNKLDLELGKWLVKQRPQLLDCRINETSEALNALASAMGCLLATIKAKSGDEAYAKTLHDLFIRADDVARRTYQSAVLKKAGGSQTTITKQ